MGFALGLGLSLVSFSVFGASSFSSFSFSSLSSTITTGATESAAPSSEPAAEPAARALLLLLLVWGVIQSPSLLAVPVVPLPQLVIGVGLTRLTRYHENAISSCGALFTWAKGNIELTLNPWIYTLHMRYIWYIHVFKSVWYLWEYVFALLGVTASELLTIFSNLRKKSTNDTPPPNIRYQLQLPFWFQCPAQVFFFRPVHPLPSNGKNAIPEPNKCDPPSFLTSRNCHISSYIIIYRHIISIFGEGWVTNFSPHSPPLSPDALSGSLECRRWRSAWNRMRSTLLGRNGSTKNRKRMKLWCNVVQCGAMWCNNVHNGNESGQDWSRLVNL